MKFIRYLTEINSIPQIFLDSFSIQFEKLQKNPFDTKNDELTGASGANLLFDSTYESSISISFGEVRPHTFTVENEHGSSVVYASNKLQKADAHIISFSKNSKIVDGTQTKSNELAELQKHALGIKTADCLPIAFAFEDENVFIGGITHAGWRGLTTNIVYNTLESLKTEAQKFNLEPQYFLSHLRVFLAPAIFGVSYECGDDVKKALIHFKSVLLGSYDLSLCSVVTKEKLSKLLDLCSDLKTDVSLNPIIFECLKLESAPKDHKIFPDVQLLAVLECVTFGVSPKHISVFRENTYGHPFLKSYREATQRKESLGCSPKSRAERQWTYLCLPCY